MKLPGIIIALIVAVFCHTYCSSNNPAWKTNSLENYHNQLKVFRNEFKAVEQPDVKFFLFGMGNRIKMIYQKGQLYNALDSAIVMKWDVAKELIIPNDYSVHLQLKNGDFVEIHEDERGVFIRQDRQDILIPGTESAVHLPSFSNHRYSEILKVLNQEILINIVDSRPVPNLFVYKKPWRRDAAMMAMCLEKTGNLSLIKDWVLSLDDPYDHNNGSLSGKPENEADNLRQSLFLLSFFSDKNHPLVAKILEEAKKFEKNIDGALFISGRSDFHEVPVYQTKWMKYGLNKLKMNDPYKIPSIKDDYSSLFWWDYIESHLDCDEYSGDFYPYLGWAHDHFHGTKTSVISNRDYPLTWETNASEADYKGLSVIDPVYVIKKTSAPHTWHASEIFLYLLDKKIFSGK